MVKIRPIATALCLGAALIAGPSLARDGAPRPPAETQTTAVEQLLTLAQIEPLIQVVATEGARHGMSLEGALFPGKGGSSWAKAVSRIQAPDRFVAMVQTALKEMLGPEDLVDATAFFDSDLGRRIIASEVETRRKMLDKETEARAKGAAAVLRRAESPRMALIEEMIEALDLVSANVSGGLNANFAFYRGLSEGGAMARRLAESEMLAMVMDQEGSIRAATEDWLRAYLHMAYTPLSDAELRAYVSFVETRAGRRYNAAMFAGFGRVFETTSYDLGLAAAQFMVAEDI